MRKIFIILAIFVFTFNSYGQEYNSTIVRNILKNNHIKSIECSIVSDIYLSNLNIRFCNNRSVFDIVTLRKDSVDKKNWTKIVPHPNIDLCNYIIMSIRDFFITKKVAIYKYMKKEAIWAYSDPEEDKLKITIDSHGKKKIISLYLGEGYTNENIRVGDKTVKYTIPFRMFIQTIDRYIAEEVGGEQLELYNHILDQVKLDKSCKIIPNAVFGTREKY